MPENLVAACRDCNRGKGALCTKLPGPTNDQLALSAALKNAAPRDVADVMRAIRPIATGRTGEAPPVKHSTASLSPEVMQYRRQLLALVGRGFTLEAAVAKKMEKAPQDRRFITLARAAIMQERQTTK